MPGDAGLQSHYVLVRNYDNPFLYAQIALRGAVALYYQNSELFQHTLKAKRMKKFFTILAVVVCCLSGNSAFAQYQKGDIAVNAGLSFGLIGYSYGSYGSSSGMPPVAINVEYSLDDRFAVGPYVGVFTRTYKYGDYKDRFTALSFGARGTFHASGFLNDVLDFNINEEKLDLYATVILGVETYSWKVDEKYVGDSYYAGGSRLILGPVVGARYQFTPNVGAFFEAGRGTFGLGTLGVTAKF